MPQEHLLFELTIAVLALGALVVILIILARINSVLRELKLTVDATCQRLEPVIEEARGVVQETQASLSTMLTHTQASVAAITTTAEEIAQMAHDQATEIRALAQDTVLAARNQVERLDDLLVRTTTRVDQTAAIIQKEVLQPIQELHCLVVGVRRALHVLFAGKQSSVDQVYQEEELFI